MLMNVIAQASGNGTGFAIAGSAMFLVLIGIAILTSIFWLWMLVDCLTRPMPSGEKIVWVLVIVFLHVLGALIYFVVRRSSASA